MAKTSAIKEWDKIPVAVYSDPIFFHKSNVKVGTRFRNVGRLTPNTTWVVQAIWTTSKGPMGNTRHYVASVRTLQDRVEMRCEENGDVKLLIFGGISYSAIWRLEEPEKPKQTENEPEPLPQRKPKPILNYKPKPHSTSVVTRARKARKQLTKEEKEDRRQRIEAVKLADDIPLAEWARNLLGDRRIEGITLQHILEGIDTYFGIFDQLRRVDSVSYRYFSRVGAPIFLDGTAVWKDHLEIPKLPDSTVLPTLIGAFFPRNAEEYRKDILEERPSMMEFSYFSKAKNLATVAPHGSTVYQYNMIGLKHEGVFSKEELKKFPEAKGNFGAWFPVAVLADGTIKALPWHMHSRQRLPRGDYVHHSSFEIPRGVVELGGHEFARLMFVITIACTASAISGLQVTISKGPTIARFGIPIQNAKEFFADREPDLTDTGRRKSIMHLRMPHYRLIKDGRIIRVGEHLRGERTFTWRGYEISVGAPGIHYPAPEGLDIDMYLQPGKDPYVLPVDNFERMVPLMNKEITQKYQRLAKSNRKVPIRRGRPTEEYATSIIPLPDIGKK